VKEIRAAIIGTGIIAHQHVKGYADCEGVNIVAAADINEAKLNAFCDEHGIPNRYLSFREMIARDDIDVVSVCLHNNLHAPVAIEVMRAGKHCYCEKPVAGSYHDAAKMLAVSEETGRMLHVQLSLIYTSAAHAAKKLIAQGLLGEVYHARSYGYRRRGRPFVDGYAEKEFDSKYWAGGGALYDMGVYHISRLLYLLGVPKLKSVSGQVYQELDMHEGRRAEGGFDVEELGVGFAKYENNLTMDIIEAWAVHAQEFPPSELYGAKGGLSIGDEVVYLSEMAGYPAKTTLDLRAETYRTHKIDPSLAMYDATIAHMVAALRGECALIDTKDLALQTLLLSEGIYQSGKLGREVTAEEIAAMSKSSFITQQDVGFDVFHYSI